jgi:hypothetical protein
MHDVTMVKKDRMSILIVDFMYVCLSMPHNVLQLPVVRFETDVYRKATNKDRMFVGICNAK